MPVLIRHRLRRFDVKLPVLTRMAQRLLDLTHESESELSLEFVSRSRMRFLNSEYRGVDRPTDVLAFPLREGPGPMSALLGDVVIALPVALKQARDYGHTVDEECVRLIIHGVLHLLGYDHEVGEGEARRMQRKERMLFSSVSTDQNVRLDKIEGSAYLQKNS